MDTYFFSLKNITDNTVSIIGLVYKIEAASARGIYLYKHTNAEHT